LAYTLRDIPELLRELDVTITRRAKVAYRPGPGGTPELDPVTMPFHEGASNALEDLRGSLRGWAQNLADDEGEELPKSWGLRSCAVYLAARAAQVRMRGWAPDMYVEVMDAVRRARRAIDAPPDLVFMGRCGDPCNEELWCPPGAHSVECRACGAVWERDELLAHFTGLAANVTAPAPVIARALTAQGKPLDAMRIYQWRKRGHLAPVGRDARTGSDLYRLGDVADVLARMERKAPKGILGSKGGKR
jgi:hypothetical protein